MAKVTVIDPQTAGISGDMLLGALIDAGAPQEKIQRVFDTIPQHFKRCKSIELTATAVDRHGFRACRAELKITEEDSEVNVQDLLEAAKNIADALRFGEKASTFAVNSVKDIVMAESSLHGSTPDKTHLHEAGSADTLADVFGIAAACNALGVFNGSIYSTPVTVGGGTVTFSHGNLAVPAPAVLEIAKQKHIPIRGGSESVELATPTGISVLANLVQSFVQAFPSVVPLVVGYGAGKIQLEGTPNILRVVIGERIGTDTDGDLVMVLETNIDDLPGEMLGHTLTRVMEAGAKDAWITPAHFKKNRPGQVLHVLCEPARSERLSTLIMEETGTLGVRYQLWNRFTLDREVRTITMSLAGKAVAAKVKFSKDHAGKTMNVKPEFDDVQAIARELSLPARQVFEMILQAARKTLKEKSEET